ncbi:MAG TPA: AMP-binding protein [Bryobacteraceae bacterium]|nr:AMP-binding protein [Bryobacteraceae bacterium]
MNRENLLGIFQDFSDRDDTFLVHDDGLRIRQFSYRNVGKAARAFASRLESAGIGKDDKLLIWAENRPEWIVALWGGLLRGAVLVPVDYRASSELLRSIQNVAQAKLLLTGDDVKLETELGCDTWSLNSIDWFASGDQISAPAVARDDIAEVLFTSGATAEPKGVIIRHKNVLANVVPVEGEVRKYLRYIKPFHPIRFLNLLPLSHMFGQAMSTFIPPMIGGTVVFMSGFNPQQIVRLVKGRRISVVVCVPKILEVLREYVIAVAPEAADPPPAGMHWTRRWWHYRRVHNLFGWKFWAFIVGAAPLDPALEEFWMRMGFVVIQGYGLTETAPIVTLNHPFHTKRGSVGTPIGGVEVKIAEDGEILVRGENVTSGYLNPGAESDKAFQDGWFHTGDIGVMDEGGRLQVRGRKKEMIVTPEGLNVFPEDVEKVLNTQPGVRESVVVGVIQDGRERIQSVLVLEDGVDPAEVVRQANSRLEDYQRIRGFTVWPGEELPRTEGTRKLKRREVQRWVQEGSPERTETSAKGSVEQIVARYAPDRNLNSETTLEELGLTSLDRIELMVALERSFGVTIDEGAFAGASTLGDLQRLTEEPRFAAATGRGEVTEAFEFPSWNRSRAAFWVRRINLPLWLLPLARVFTHVRVEGLENLKGLEPPVIFAPTHQSHLDVPAMMLALPAKWRYRLAPAMSKEFFRAHFYPKEHGRGEWFTNSLNYYLSALVFNAFPLPQREAGARQTIRYAGELASEGWCITIFPEGRLTDTGEIARFQPGVGMLASRLNLPVVPVRLEGLDKVLHRTWRMARPGPVTVKFGSPLRLTGDDYAALAKQVEDAVRAL